MHGSFYGRIEGEDGITVRFAARLAAAPATLEPGPRKRRARFATLLAGCGLAFLPNTSLPTVLRKISPSPLASHQRVSLQAEEGGATERSFVTVASPTRLRVQHLAVDHSATDEPVLAAEFSPLRVPIVLHAARIAEPEKPSSPPTEIPGLAIVVQATPPVGMNLAEPPTLSSTDVELPKMQASAITPPPAELRAVDVAQISDSEVNSLRVPQPDERGLAASGEQALSARIAAMQVTPLPPTRVGDSERLAMLVDAPTQMTLRIGRSALGKVDFRVTETHTIDVRVAGLLDLLASRYDADEFARLRSSAAADAYVSFDQLRALGLNVHYDAVYDELRING